MIPLKLHLLRFIVVNPERGDCKKKLSFNGEIKGFVILMEILVIIDISMSVSCL